MNSQNNSITNRNTSAQNNDSNPLKYSGLLFFIFLLVCGLLGYTIYHHYQGSFLMEGHSYLSKDIKSLDYLFEHKESSKEKCVEDCKSDYLCHGVTFDASQNICYGVRDGRVREDETYLYAWEKEKDGKVSEDNLILSWTNGTKKINHRQLPVPPFIGHYGLNFWFKIEDWYYNHTFWRGIIYQGSEIKENSLQATTWSEVTNKIPKQRFGVWLAPYTNNIRIVIGTNVPYNTGAALDHPKNQICTGKNCTMDIGQPQTDSVYFDLEHVDIKDVGVNTNIMISLVLDDGGLSVYYNGKLRHNIFLDGRPVPFNLDCYIKPDKSYKGTFQMFRFFPKVIDSNQIAKLYTDEISKLHDKARQN